MKQYDRLTADHSQHPQAASGAHVRIRPSGGLDLQICVGNVLQPGAGGMSSRVAQIRAGISHTVPLSTVNRQCSSGLQALANVASGIRAGYYAIGIAAGEF